MTKHLDNKYVIFVVGFLLVGIGFFAGRINMYSSTGDVPTTNRTKSQEVLWTCSMHPQVIRREPGLCPICHMELVPLKQLQTTSTSAIQIDPAIVQNMGVRTSVVKRGALVQSVRVVGYLEEPEPLHRDINLRVNGWIEKLYADTDGMAITKGMALFDIYSPELTVAVGELISARKQSGSDDLTKVLFDSARRKLIQYGLDELQVDELSKLDSSPKSIPILSPISGHMTAKMVYEGAAIKAGDLVLRLASRHRMWIEAQVYEQQLPLIKDGQPAQIKLVSQPGRVIEGKVLFVHPHVDPRTRTALARIEIPNHDMTLRQGMYATVDILADSYVESLIIPREAVIDSGRNQVVFISLGGGIFEPRTVSLGAAGLDGTIEVKEGVTAGELVVTSGQFLLDSESRIREAIAKFGDNRGKNIDSNSRVEHPSSGDRNTEEKLNIAQIDVLISKYLIISKKLGEREPDNPSPVDVTTFLDHARLSMTQSDNDSKKLLETLIKSIEMMQGKSITAQRESFIETSRSMISIVNKSIPSLTIYKMHCPMAFHHEGADWLQDNPEIANPFYAREMKSCGTIESKFEPVK